MEHFIKEGGSRAMLAVHSSISSKIVHRESDQFEHLVIIITIASVNCLINVDYFPPLRHSHLYSIFCNTMHAIFIRYKFNNYLILGDFSFPGYEWPTLQPKLFWVNILTLKFVILLQLLKVLSYSRSYYSDPYEKNIFVHQPIDVLSVIDPLRAAQLIPPNLEITLRP